MVMDRFFERGDICIVRSSRSMRPTTTPIVSTNKIVGYSGGVPVGNMVQRSLILVYPEPTLHASDTRHEELVDPDELFVSEGAVTTSAS